MKNNLKSKISLTKAITLGLLLSVGVGYSISAYADVETVYGISATEGQKVIKRKKTNVVVESSDKNVSAVYAEKNSSIRLRRVKKVAATSNLYNAYAVSAKSGSTITLKNLEEISAYAAQNAVAVEVSDGAEVNLIGVTSTAVSDSGKGTDIKVKPPVKLALFASAMQDLVADSGSVEFQGAISNVIVSAYAGKTAKGIVGANNSKLTFDGLSGIVVKAFGGDIKGNPEGVESGYNPEDYKAVGLELNNSTLETPYIGAIVEIMTTDVPAIVLADGTVAKEPPHIEEKGSDGAVTKYYGIAAEATVGNAYAIEVNNSKICGKQTVIPYAPTEPLIPIINNVEEIKKGIDDGSSENGISEVPTTNKTKVSVPVVIAEAPHASAYAMKVSGVESYVGLQDVEMISAYAAQNAVAVEVSDGAEVNLIGVTSTTVSDSGSSRSKTSYPKNPVKLAPISNPLPTAPERIDTSAVGIYAASNVDAAEAVKVSSGGKLSLTDFAVIGVHSENSDAYAVHDCGSSDKANEVTVENIQKISVVADRGAAALVYVKDAKATDGDTISLKGVKAGAVATITSPAYATDGKYLNLLAVEGAGSKVNLSLENIAVVGKDSKGNGADTNIFVDRGAAANVDLKASSFKGAVEQRGRRSRVNMTLDENSYWGVTGDSRVRTLNNAGTVDLTADGEGDKGSESKYNKLEVKSLQYNIGDVAKFKLDVNMNPDIVADSQKTDEVIVHAVTISPGLGEDDKISLDINPNFVNINENDDIVSLLKGDNAPQMMKLPAGSHRGAEIYDITLGGAENFDFGPIRTNVAPVVSLSTGTVSLALEPTKENGKQVLSAKGNAAMSAVIDPETWHMDNEALYENISNLRPERERSDVWASYTNKKNTYDDSFQDVAKNGDIDKRYSGVVLGIDNKAKYYQKANANLFVGVMFSYGDGKYNWADGSNELDGAGVGLYAIYKTAKGAYFGATAKYNRYSFDEIKGTQMGSWKSFNGEYDTDALGLSLVAGRRYAKDQMQGFYVEPQAELAYVNYGSDKYDLDGMDVEVNSMKSLRARLGFQIGSRNVSKKTFSDIYAKVSFLHEFFGDNDINMGAYTYESDQGGSWVNFALGFSVGSMDKFNANFSANLSRGSHKSKVGFKTVMNWMF